MRDPRPFLSADSWRARRSSSGQILLAIRVGHRPDHPRTSRGLTITHRGGPRNRFRHDFSFQQWNRLFTGSSASDFLRCQPLLTQEICMPDRYGNGQHQTAPASSERKHHTTGPPAVRRNTTVSTATAGAPWVMTVKPSSPGPAAGGLVAAPQRCRAPYLCAKRTTTAPRQRGEG